MMVLIEQTLKEVLARVNKYRSLYEKNEEAVRSQLLNPILRSLGWDPENPEEVRPNIRTEEGIPDYSLIKNGRTVLFIEAKKLSVDVKRADVLRQLAKYCFGDGIEYGVLTNGTQWALFKAFRERTRISERVVWHVDLEQDGITASVKKLRTISKEMIDQIEILIQKAGVLDSIWLSITERPRELVKALVPFVAHIAAEDHPDYKFESTEIEEFLEDRIRELVAATKEMPETSVITTDLSPRRITINGQTMEIRHSYEILVKTAEWLIQRGKLRRNDCPVETGHKRYLVSTQPVHRDGGRFRAARKLSNGLFIETHYSTESAIEIAKRLLERFGFSRDLLTVE